MPSTQILYLKSQKGKLELDAQKCYDKLQEACWELLQQHHEDDKIPQHMFRSVDGKIEVYDGGYDAGESWGNRVNLWGYSSEYILKALSKNIKGQGELIFVSTPEGNPPTVYKVTTGKVEVIA